MTPAPPLRRLAASAAALLALVVLGVTALATGPAGAHGGPGEMEVVSLTRAGDEVTALVRLTYVEDGHGVPDATVTVVVDDGTSTPMDPGDEEGDYQATVTAAPGATLRFTSVEPPTTVEAEAPPAEETTTTTTEDATSTTAAPTTEAPTTTEAADETTTTGATDAATTTDDDSDDGPSTLLLLGGGVVAVAVIAAVVLAVRKSDPGGPTGDGA